MPYRCSVKNCNGNYNKEKACTVYKLPANPQNQQQWGNVIPKEKGSKISIKYFRVCEKHWLNDTQMVKVQGGKSRPSVPPSIFIMFIIQVML